MSNINGSVVSKIAGPVILLLGIGVIASSITGQGGYVIPLSAAIMALSAAVIVSRRSARLM